jgi:hypothetical protein
MTELTAVADARPEPAVTGVRAAATGADVVAGGATTLTRMTIGAAAACRAGTLGCVALRAATLWYVTGRAAGFGFTAGFGFALGFGVALGVAVAACRASGRTAAGVALPEGIRAATAATANPTASTPAKTVIRVKGRTERRRGCGPPSSGEGGPSSFSC